MLYPFLIALFFLPYAHAADRPQVLDRPSNLLGGCLGRYENLRETVAGNLGQQTGNDFQVSGRKSFAKGGAIFFQDSEGKVRTYIAAPISSPSIGKSRLASEGFKGGMEPRAYDLPVYASDLRNAFSIYPRSGETAGSLVPVRYKLNGTEVTDVGEVISVDPENDVARVMTKKEDGTSAILKIHLSSLVSRAVDIPKARFRGQNFAIANPRSYPDGILVPGNGEGGGMLTMIHRKEDPNLAAFLKEGIPVVTQLSPGGRPPSNSEKVDRAVKFVQDKLSFAHPGQTVSGASDQWQRNRDVAAAEGRGVLAGDALFLGRGVCKDFAIATTVLLCDSDVPVRHVSGRLKGG